MTSVLFGICNWCSALCLRAHFTLEHGCEHTAWQNSINGPWTEQENLWIPWFVAEKIPDAPRASTVKRDHLCLNLWPSCITEFLSWDWSPPKTRDLGHSLPLPLPLPLSLPCSQVRVNDLCCSSHLLELSFSSYQSPKDPPLGRSHQSPKLALMVSHIPILFVFEPQHSVLDWKAFFQRTIWSEKDFKPATTVYLGSKLKYSITRPAAHNYRAIYLEVKGLSQTLLLFIQIAD